MPHHQEQLDQVFIKQALNLAKKAAEKGNEPFGALLAKGDRIVANGQNQIHSQSDPTYHAELGLVRTFCTTEKIVNLSEYTLYTSCEPCCMCAGALVWSKVGRVVYSLSHDELAEIAGFNIMIGSDEVFEKSPFQPLVTKGLLKAEAQQLYRHYFQSK